MSNDKSEIDLFKLASNLMIYLGVCLLISGPAQASSVSDKKYAFTVNPDTLLAYYKYLDGREPLTIKNYDSQWSRRDIIEIVVWQQALSLADITIDYEFVEIDNYARAMLSIEKGEFLGSANSFWLSDFDGKTQLTHSSAIIPKGHFTAGIVVHKDNPRTRHINNLAQLKDLTAIVNFYWTGDLTTLESLQIKNMA